MKKSLSVMLMLALFVGQLIASPVDVNTACQLSLKYVQGNATKKVANLDLAYTQTTESGANALYVFNFEGGYMIMAADDVAQPILAFGEEGCFDANNIPDGLAYYLRHYARQIEYAVTNNMTADPEIAEQWEQIRRDGVIRGERSMRGDVAPLISTNWNQDHPFNYYCPTGHGGPNGRAYAGCVATAMSMVMKRWNWPDHGQGSHSYTPSGYATQSVDFENTYYQWDNMPNSVNNSNYQAVALLMYHCGVAVDMQYGADGSGAHSQDVPDAIFNYFRYTKNANRLDRDLYTRNEWEEILISNLQEGFPMYYSGAEGNSGHAFVCCGYRESDRKFYFNWGWSGFNNNYFAIDALNTYSGNFNDYQGVIIDMIPDYVYDGLIPAVTDLEVVAENAHSNVGVVSWTNPTSSLDGTTLENIEQVVLLRNDQEIFSQANVVPGEVMTFEDNVPDYDCYNYRIYFVSNGAKGRPAEFRYQYGPTCTWKVVGQTTNFQGWNGGKIQVKNRFGSVIKEVTMTGSTPISQQIAMPEGNVTFNWVAPNSTVSNMTINIKNSSNSSVYTFTGNSNQVPATLYTGDNDCAGCQPPTNLAGEYQWTNEGFGTMLTWSYDEEPQSFKVYRSEDGINYEMIATVDKTLREYLDIVDAGDYYYQVTAFRSYCESTPAWVDEETDYVHVEVTSVSENGDAGLSVYPNPANTLMSVEAEGLQQVTICNVMGQVVKMQRCAEDGVVINTADLASGIYTISVKTNQGTMMKRFSVIH
ncbi:MAG: thiol protease/hemagglutinin PrtT [Bacteroidales bacterium]|nr:thiol protease/hemagglutinin PrtT [Bacteroidales bacterium]